MVVVGVIADTKKRSECGIEFPSSATSHIALIELLDKGLVSLVYELV